MKVFLFTAILVLLIPLVSADEVTDLILDLSGSSGEKWMATYELSKIGEPAVEPLILALNDSRLSMVALTLGLIGDPRAIEPLVVVLNDSDSAARAAAANALGVIGDPLAFDPLIAALNDSDSNIRRKAAESLGDMGDDRAIEPLTYLANNDPNVRVRNAADQALDLINGTQPSKS